MAADVIEFPQSDEVIRMPTTMAEVRASIETIRHVHINEVTEVLVSTMVQQMLAGGFNVLEDEHDKDFGFLIEAVRSTLCKTVSIYHPFQDVAQSIMERSEDSETLTIAEAINVKFHDEDGAGDEDAVEAT